MALGLRPSLHAAAQATDALKVSMQLKLQQPPWAAGYRVRVLDGNHLTASQKRLKLLRGFRGAALPGQSLGVYAPEWDLVGAWPLPAPVRGGAAEEGGTRRDGRRLKERKT